MSTEVSPGVFLFSLLVLVYAAMSVDVNRKAKNCPGIGENTFMYNVNIVMLVGAILTTLYTGYHLFATPSMRAQVQRYF